MMDKELALNHRMQVVKREQCDSLDNYLSKNKTLCDKLATIIKSLIDNRKSF